MQHVLQSATIYFLYTVSSYTVCKKLDESFFTVLFLQKLKAEEIFN